MDDDYWNFKADTAQDVLDHFLGEEYRPSRSLSTLMTGRNGFIFRGQEDADWPLLPKAHRPGVLAEWAPQPLDREAPPGEASRRQHVGSHMYEEVQAVNRFLGMADGLGLPTPIDYTLAKAHHDGIYTLWNENAAPASEPFPDERLWPAFALAQHNGVPTRFLDWTENPLVAMFFAAYNASQQKDTPYSGSGQLGIFVVHVEAFSGTQVRLVEAPRHANHFLRCQSGLFTVDVNANQLCLESGRWPSMVDALPPRRVRRIAVPATEADEVLRRLFTFSITRHHLMPTLENAAKAIDYQKRLFRHPAAVAEPS